LKLTPLDVRKQTFKRALRGFDADEVETFLEMISSEMEALIKENVSLTEKLKMITSQLEDYSKLERTLRDSVLTAQKVTDASKQTAQREAELVIKEAEAQAERILDEYQKKVISLKRELTELKKQNNLYLSRMQSLVDTQLRILKYHQMDMESGEAMPDLSTALSKIKPRGAKAAPTSSPAAEEKREAQPAKSPEPKPPVKPLQEPAAPTDDDSGDIDSRLLME
jgi:cell division initiation protein